MAARFDDAKAGWELLRSSGFSWTRDELNARLEALGRHPISQRTFAHYQKLKRYGYERYVPINQLDVKSLKDPLWDDAVRGRYTVYREPVEVKVLSRIGGDELEIPGRTLELSPSFVRVQVDHSVAVSVLQSKSTQRELRDQRVTVHFPGQKAEFAASLEELSTAPNDGAVTLGMRFLSLAPVEALTERILLPTATLIACIEPSEKAPLLSDIVRKLYWLFQVMDTCKVIAEEFLFELGFGDTYAVPQVRVCEMDMRSHIEVSLIGALPTLLLVTTLAERLAQTEEELSARDEVNDDGQEFRFARQLFSETSVQIKRRMMTEIALREQQVRLPLNESFGRSGELAVSQLLPALRELLDEASGKVTLKLPT